jgi:hypothetical protein
MAGGLFGAPPAVFAPANGPGAVSCCSTCSSQMGGNHLGFVVLSGPYGDAGLKHPILPSLRYRRAVTSAVAAFAAGWGDLR